MDNKHRNRLEKNIVKYAWFKIFNKRVYLPLIVIHLANVGHVTIDQLALIAIAGSLTQLILQIPAGYIADKWGNKRALILGTIITAISPLFYVFMPNFVGGLLAAIFFFGGYAFQTGVIEAFMHDTLVALGKEKQYAKIMGKAYSYGLIGNVLLLALIPATYPLNHSLPFVLGFISLLIMVWLATSFAYPPIRTDSQPKNPFVAAKNIITAQNITLFAFAGLMAGVAERALEYRELLFQDIGVAVTLFGLIVAMSSIAGAILGQCVHLLDKLKPLTFYLVDLTFITACLALIGLSRHPAIVIAGFTLFAGYGRVRLIIFHAKLLHTIKHAYKATLLSALNLFTILGEVCAVALLARLIGLSGYSTGYLLLGAAVFCIGLMLWLIMKLGPRACR